jgi:hypothetical protein
MSEQNAIVTTSNKIDSVTVKAAREIAQRIKFMIVNGNKLTDQEVYALAHYSAANGLNPFAQECYYLPGTGPITGIVGFRRKAQEALIDECRVFGINDPQNFWIESRTATQEEATFDPDKDIAVFVTLRDSITNKTWRRSYFDTVRELRDLGEKDPFEKAKEYVGPEPVWTGVATVKGTENFGKDTFDRHERAAKRAEKCALKKRFPSLQSMKDTDHFEDTEQVEWDENVFDSNAEEQKQLTPERKAENAKIFGEPTPGKSTASMTLEEAAQMTSSKGIAYGARPDSELIYVRDNPKSPSDKALAAGMVLEDRATRGVGVPN